jgi:hypothetical protein
LYNEYNFWMDFGLCKWVIFAQVVSWLFLDWLHALCGVSVSL